TALERPPLPPPPLGVKPVQFPPPPPTATPEPEPEPEPAPEEESDYEEVVEEPPPKEQAVDDDVNFVEMATRALDATLLALANEMIRKAAEKGYTHVHIEPTETDLELRFWIEHELIESSQLEKNIHKELVACFKSIAGLDIDEMEKPQDKRLHAILANNEIDLRVTTIPGEYGEMVAVSIKFPDEE
ncbi:MAG TPA: ATPase, T2SS/T4P/T4SS family, partial [Candidatus Obscuribacterales bacterium]